MTSRRWIYFLIQNILVRNNGADPLVLNGWMLRDGDGNIFVFPLYSLTAGGTVQIHTAIGTDAASSLYWGRSSPVWQSGELAALYDPGGTARAFYKIP